MIDDVTQLNNTTHTMESYLDKECLKSLVGVVRDTYDKICKLFEEH